MLSMIHDKLWDRYRHFRADQNGQPYSVSIRTLRLPAARRQRSYQVVWSSDWHWLLASQPPRLRRDAFDNVQQGDHPVPSAICVPATAQNCSVAAAKAPPDRRRLSHRRCQLRAAIAWITAQGMNRLQGIGSQSLKRIRQSTPFPVLKTIPAYALPASRSFVSK